MCTQNQQNDACAIKCSRTTHAHTYLKESEMSTQVQHNDACAIKSSRTTQNQTCPLMSSRMTHVNSCLTELDMPLRSSRMTHGHSSPAEWRLRNQVQQNDACVHISNRISHAQSGPAENDLCAVRSSYSPPRSPSGSRHTPRSGSSPGILHRAS
jgi:hypothetical protein